MAPAPTQAIETEVPYSGNVDNISVVRHYGPPLPPQRRLGGGWTAGGWIAGAAVGGVLLGVSVGWLATPVIPESSANRVHTEAIAFPAHNLSVAESFPADQLQTNQSQTVVPVYYAAPKANASKFAASAAADLEAIRIRNRRLEALVKVLRHRTAAERRAPVASRND